MGNHKIRKSLTFQNYIAVDDTTRSSIETIVLITNRWREISLNNDCGRYLVDKPNQNLSS